MRTRWFLFVVGVVVGTRIGFGAEHSACVEDGVFPCVGKDVTTDAIVQTALDIMKERQAAINKDPEDAVKRKLAKKFESDDGTVTYYPLGDTCKKFVQLLVLPQLGGELGSYYRNAYCKCGYEINASEARPGDIIQVSHDLKHEGDAEEIKLHTAIIVKVLGGGWFNVVDSNYVASFSIGTHDWNPQESAKKLPSKYDEFHIKDPVKQKAAAEQWDKEKVNWNAHFYRFAPLPGQTGVVTAPSVSPYPVDPFFVGHGSDLGYALSPAYDYHGNVAQDFQFGRLLRNGINLVVWKVLYPQNVGPGQMPSGLEHAEKSKAFARAYGKLIERHGGNQLGFPYDNGGGAYVHTWNDPTALFNPTVQDFYQPLVPHFGPDGKSALVYSDYPIPSAYNIKGIFWDEYKHNAWRWGQPLGDAVVWVDKEGSHGEKVRGYAYLAQGFEYGTMLWNHYRSILEDVRDDLTADVGASSISELLTIAGWAVSNRQIYLHSTGGEEPDQHGYRAWYVNGSQYEIGYTPELTIIGLEPGATYTFRTEQVQNDEVVTVSNDLTLTMPQADVFAVRVTLKQANAVSISIANQRFPVVIYYVVYRDGVPIVNLSGEGYGDFDLEYSRTYTYQVAAMTASHMELGRTDVVTITTSAQPTTPEVPLDPSRPASITLSVNVSKVAAFTHVAQAVAILSDQFGRQMSGRVLFVSSNPAVATIDADRGDIIAEAPGTVDINAVSYDNRDVWSPPVTFTVHPADWTPPKPPYYRAIAADQALDADAAGHHWSDQLHAAWWSDTPISHPNLWLTEPIALERWHLYVLPQHIETGQAEPVNGFTWHPEDGRVGVYIQAQNDVQLYVNGQFVGAWGDPNGNGRQPINLPELGTTNAPSIDLSPVEITSRLIPGNNTLALYLTAGVGAPALHHLEFVNLDAAQPIVNAASAPSLAASAPASPSSSTSPSSSAIVLSDDFNRQEFGPNWKTCGNVGLSPDGVINVWGDNACLVCGFGSVAGIHRDFPALPEPEATLELFISNDYGGRNNLIYLVFGDFWVGAQDHPQARAAIQFFYRSQEITRVWDFRFSPGWYELSISGGVLRFRTVRLLHAGDAEIDVAESFARFIDPADPPKIDHLCLLGNELGGISFDDVVIRDLSAPAVPLQTAVLPNLAAALSLESASLTAADQANIGVTVEDRSPTASPASLLSLSVDGAFQRTFTIPELAANDRLVFTVPLASMAAGSHTVAVVADSDGKIAESDENNGASLTIVVNPALRPDLVISALTIPASGYVGDNLPVHLTVYNRGEAASSPCLLSCGFGGTTEASVSNTEVGQMQFILPELQPGATVSFTTTLRFAAADTFTFWADVDSNAEVVEGKEDNNQKSLGFVVTDNRPDLMIRKVTILLREQWVLWYEVVVENAGRTSVPLRDVVVHGFLSRDQVPSNADDRDAGEATLGYTGVLAPGQRQAVRVFSRLWQPVFSYADYAYLVVVVDWPHTISESNEQNNTAVLRVGLAGTVLFSDTFESGTLAKWRLNRVGSGNRWYAGISRSPTGGKAPINGQAVLYLGDTTSGGYATSSAEFTVNLSGYRYALLELAWNTINLRGSEGLFVDIYDGSWHTNVFSQQATGWFQVAFDLSSYKMASTFIVRFRSYLDNPERVDAAYLDNVKLTASK